MVNHQYTIILIVCLLLIVPVFLLALDMHVRDTPRAQEALIMATAAVFFAGVLTGLLTKRWVKKCSS